MTFNDSSSWETMARKLDSESGLGLLRQLQSAGIIAAPQSVPEQKLPVEPSSTGSNRVAISLWKPIERQGAWFYERPEPGPFDDHYGKQKTFREEKPEGRLRVAFFGESVAAGYLLAPHLTPATVLERKLKKAYPHNSWEVLDFSRTNETLASMIQTAEASCQISPDVLIFFAGNNWPLLEMAENTPFLPSVSTRQALAEAWKKGRMPEVKATEQRLLLQRVGAKLDRLGRFLCEKNLPAIWLIPEVNLVDWDHAQPLPGLDAGAFASWYRIKDEAIGYLQTGAFADAEKAGWALLELDQGASPVGYRILGKALLGGGKFEEARLAFEYEVQNVGYAGSCFLGAPQLTPQLRRLITQFASRHKIISVDLKQVFCEQRPGHLPDKQFFFDYCHLTKTGTAVAMHALLEPLQTALSLVNPEPVDLEEGSELSPQAEAVAHLGAAIHSCHRQIATVSTQTPWTYWIENALALDQAVLAHLRSYVEARLSPAPIVFSKAQAENLSREVNLNPQHGWFYDYLDAPILEVILKLLEIHAPTDFAAMNSRMIRLWGVENEPVDLLQPAFFLWQPLARILTDVMAHSSISPSAFLRCMQPETHFAFITSGKVDLSLGLIARRPPRSSDEKESRATVTVNGARVSQTSLEVDWSEQLIELPAEFLRPGLNKLTMTWTTPCIEGFCENTLDQLTMGRDASFFPQFAQVYSVKMSGKA